MDGKLDNKLNDKLKSADRVQGAVNALTLMLGGAGVLVFLICALICAVQGRSVMCLLYVVLLIQTAVWIELVYARGRATVRVTPLIVTPHTAELLRANLRSRLHRPVAEADPQ